jgi:hypothetical protein
MQMSSFEHFDWCSIEKRYVLRDTVAETTFGELDDAARWHVEGALRPANDNAPTIDDMGRLPGYLYLGSPYSKYELGHDAAAYVVGRAAGQLMARGLRIYCPIVHGHYIAKTHKLPEDWSFWKDQCQPMIDAAAALIVLQMDGWDESVGLTYEIEEFRRAGKPVAYVTPAALNHACRRVA